MNDGEELGNLIEKAKLGDKDANEVFAEKCKAEAYRIATARVGDRLLQHLEVDDIVQSALRRVVTDVQALDFRGTDAWRAWLRQIIEHTIVDAGRRMAAGVRQPPGSLLPLDQGTASDTGVPPVVAAYTGPGPSSIASKKEQFEVLLEAMASLPEDYRKAIQLHYFGGLTVAQVAERLGRSTKAAEDLLARARKAVEKATGRIIDA